MYTNELYHHGVLGQKWGVRRYQNADGTLTTQGKMRYKAQHPDDMNAFNRLKYNVDKKKFDKDTERADKRLSKRERYIEKKSNEVKTASKLGTMNNIRRAAAISENNKHVRDMTKFFNENPDQKQRLGRITKRQRVATAAGTGAAAAGAAYVTAALAGSGAVALLPAAAIAAGGAYVYHLTGR